MVVGQSVSVRDSAIGLVVAKHLEGSNVRVMMDVRGALAFGASLGAVLALMRLWGRRTRARRRPDMKVLDLTRALLHYNTINPPGEEQACARHVGRILEDAGFTVKEYEFAERRTSLVARLGGTGRRSPAVLHRTSRRGAARRTDLDARCLRG